MKTGTKQLRVRKDTHCIQTTVPCRNHPHNILAPNAAPPNPAKSRLKNKNALSHLSFLRLLPLLSGSVFIRVHPWLKRNKKLPNEPILHSRIDVAIQPLAPIHDWHDSENEPIFESFARSFAT